MELIKHTYLRIAFCSLAAMLVFESGFSQETEEQSQDYKDSVIIGWIQELYTSDIFVEGDSTRYLLEKEKLLGDSVYRQLVYPETYTWPVAAELIQRQELKKAFWYFINLYRDDKKNKEMVLKCFLTYAKIFKMDEVIFNTFYTYCATDPQISEIKNGEAIIYAPHILEEKEDAMIEILAYMKQYREKNDMNEHGETDGHDHGEGSVHHEH
jgi:hypothetical protein